MIENTIALSDYFFFFLWTSILLLSSFLLVSWLLNERLFAVWADSFKICYWMAGENTAFKCLKLCGFFLQRCIFSILGSIITQLGWKICKIIREKEVNMFEVLGHWGTLVAHVQLSIDQHPQILFISKMWQYSQYNITFQFIFPKDRNTGTKKKSVLQYNYQTNYHYFM